MEIKKTTKWNNLPIWQKIMLVVLGIILIPGGIILLVLFLIGRSKELPTIENEKWHHKQQEKKVKQAKNKIKENKDKINNLVVEEEKLIKEVEKTNEAASKIIEDIHNAKSAKDRELIRQKINSIK